MRYLMTLLLTIVLIACQNGENSSGNNEGTPTPADAESQLYQEMMDIHDLVMPKMGQLNQLSQQLTTSLTTLGKEQENIKTQIEKTIKDLQQADEGMMDWMHGVKPLGQLRKEKKHEDIMGYIEAEKSKIEKVQQLTDVSIKSAEQILKGLEEEKK